MMYLLLTIILTVLVFVILKEFDRFKLDNFQAIVVNYFVAFGTGVWFNKSEYSVAILKEVNWLWGALAISILFIIVFNLMAVTAQKGGLFVMTVAGKMSMIIPILAGVLLYGDSFGVLKIIGVSLALLGVWYAAKKEQASGYDKKLWYLPFLIFIGGGTADALINHMQTEMVPKAEYALFSTTLFLFCGLIGFFFFIVKLLLKKTKICFKSWIGGIVLGVPNFFAIYYFVKALSQSQYGTAFVFSVNNLLIVLGSLLFSLLMYNEKLSKQNYLGLALSVSAIAVLYFAL